MWRAIVITLIASSLNNLGKAFQKQATDDLPQLTLQVSVLSRYLTSRRWMVGVIADVLGGALMVGAYAEAPVSVVQPVGGLGLVVLALYSHVVMKDRLKLSEWAAAGVAAVGTIGLGITSSESPPVEGGAPPVSPGAAQMMLTFGGLVAAFVAFTMYRHSRLARTANPGGKDKDFSAADKRNAIIAGLEAGTCFGFSAAATRTGFMVGARPGSWGVVCVPIGIACSLGLSSAGFYLQTAGLKDGHAVVICTCATVSAMLSGVAVGLLALREPLPGAPGVAALRFLSWAAICFGVTVMATGLQGFMELLAGAAEVLRIRRASSWVWGVLPRQLQLRLRGLHLRLMGPSSRWSLPVAVSTRKGSGSHAV